MGRSFGGCGGFLCVCGARPNFVKVAPILEAFADAGVEEVALVHTGQHYDERMSRRFFDELGIRHPDVNLGVGSGSQASQTADVMRRFEPVCVERNPDWVIVVGDVNSTMACALVAAKLGCRLAHVEAGLRSFDRTMPEEINRIVTDSVSDALFVSERSGVENLRHEGAAEEKIHFVGNVMVDTLMRRRAAADRSTILAALGLTAGRYALVTLHRPSNVDDAKALSRILDALEVIANELPVVFPVHPRTTANLDRFGLSKRLASMPQLHPIEPLGYLDFLKLMADAAVVLTDSGGIQEETTVLGVACLTLRDNTERPITLTQGTSRLTGNRTDRILSAYRDIRADPPVRSALPPLWDGAAARRIVDCLLRGRVEETVGRRLVTVGQDATGVLG